VNGIHGSALLGLVIASSAPGPAPLAEPEKEYVELMTASLAIINMCDRYDVDERIEICQHARRE
jgi:hypothetical protein